MKIIANQEVKDPRIPRIITITNVSLSKDLHYCHLYFSLLENKDKNKAVTGLNSAAGYFQKIIAERMKLKYTPIIEFRYDDIEEKAHKVDELLDSLTDERKNKENIR
jgi:ribosome-binding factor A